MNKIDAVLGQKTVTPQLYTTDILVREDRQKNRTPLDIDKNNLPFVGYDTWNCWEASCLTNNGFPVVGIVKIVYSSSSQYHVESKSLKLYLNSFNMTRLGKTVENCIKEYQRRVAADLSSLLETDVKCKFFVENYSSNNNMKPLFQIYDKTYNENCYENLENYHFINEELTTYNENPDLLEGIVTPGVTRVEKLHSGLLKSNCKVTHAPDWGDVFIHIKSNYSINKASLLKYIISFRGENHFHEEITETMYKRLYDKFNPLELMVCCLYTRRGGIDINPIRANKALLLNSDLIDPEIPHYKTSKQ